MSANTHTGVDHHLEFLLGTAFLSAFAGPNVTNFSVQDSYDEIRWKGLGRSGTHASNDFAGYDIEFTVVDTHEIIEAFRDQVTAASVARVPLPITLVHTRIARITGRPTVHTYTPCVVTFGTSVQREQAVEISVSAFCGSPRLVS